MIKRFLLLSSLLFSYTQGKAQIIDDDQLGAWYMYFYSKTFKESN